MEKYEYSPVKISIIIIIGLILFIVIGILYDRKNDIDKELICTTSSEYDETLSFYFVNDKLFSYTREEYFEFASKSDLEKWIKHFEEEKEKLTLDEYFKYDIIVDEFKLTIKTYIDVANKKYFFNEYIKNLNMSADTSFENIKLNLEKKKYSCKVK